MSNFLHAGSNYVYDFFKNFQPAESAREVERVIVKEMSTVPATRFFVRVAGLSGAAAVVLGAYGAHVFHESNADAKLKAVFETGSRYHYMHSLALLGSPLCRRPLLVGTLMITGMTLFSGSCYAHALTGNNTVRKVTPYGGIILIIAWLAMLL